MVRTWLLSLWSWVRGLFRTEVPQPDFSDTPFTYAQILKSSKVGVSAGPLPFRKSQAEKLSEGVFEDSGIPSCKHVRTAKFEIPPELYSDLGMDPYSVGGYFMNSGDLFGVCLECQHQRVYPKDKLELFEIVGASQHLPKLYGFDNFDRQLYHALKASRIGSAVQ